MDAEWVYSLEELPPEDGYYYITNNAKNLFDFGVAFYDGWGFKTEWAYREPLYWAPIPHREKRYGKAK